MAAIAILSTNQVVEFTLQQGVPSLQVKDVVRATFSGPELVRAFALAGRAPLPGALSFTFWGYNAREIVDNWDVQSESLGFPEIPPGFGLDPLPSATRN